MNPARYNPRLERQKEPKHGKNPSSAAPTPEVLELSWVDPIRELRNCEFEVILFPDIRI